MNSQRIKAILADQDFVAFLDNHMERLTKKVMSASATKQDRKQALAEHHALTRLFKAMTAEAQNVKENSDE